MSADVAQGPAGPRYRGRRRVADPASRRRLSVLAIVACGSLASAVALALVGSNRYPGQPHGGTVQPAPAASLPSIGAPPSPASTATTGPTRSRAEPTRSGPPTKSSAPFTPVAYEAEAATNTVSGSAHVSTYPGASGGKIVRNIGAWGGAAGVLRFGSVTVPADGTYTLAFFYVHLDDQPSRTAVITVAGQDPISVPVTGGSICCVTKVITVVLTKGANVVTFTNPGGQAPSIDKIVIGTP